MGGASLRIFFDKNNFDIFFLVEDKGSSKKVKLPGYYMISVKPVRNSGGVSALVKTAFKHQISKHSKSARDRLWVEQRTATGMSIFYCSAYAPNSLPKTAARTARCDKFFLDLLTEIIYFKTLGLVILIGDLNGRLADFLGDKKWDGNADRIMDLIQATGFSVLNKIFAYGTPTFRREGKRHTSIIDLVMASPAVAHTRIKNFKISIVDTKDYHAHNTVISFSVSGTIFIENPPKQNMYFKLDVSNADIFYKKLQNQISAQTIKDRFDVEKALVNLTTGIQRVRETVLKKAEYGGNNTGAHTNQGLKELAKKLDVCQSKIHSDPPPPPQTLTGLEAKYRAIKIKYNKMVEAVAHHDWLKRLSELEQMDMHRRTRKFYEMLRKWRGHQETGSGVINSPRGKASANREDFLKYWAMFYEILYANPGTPPFEAALAKLRNRDRHKLNFPGDPLNEPISRSEFNEAVKSQRAEAAAGADGISPRVIKSAPEWLLDYIFEILAKAWDTEAPLKTLKMVILAPLLKDPQKDIRDPNNYRPIALIMSLLKLFETILQRRLSDFFEGMLPGLGGEEPIFKDFTTGFRPGRSTLDNILTLKELCLDYRENQNRKPLFIGFLDIRKAFDTVNRDILWDTLWNCGVRGKMWRVLVLLFSGFKGKVRVLGLLTQEFEIERGVIQGSRLGPILFNIFFTTIINKISNLPGAQFSFGLKISILTYADDIILLASSWASMQRLVNACFIHSEDNGYVYAPGKCKIIVLHINYEKLNPIFLGDVALEYVRQYKYLGVDFEQRFLNFSAYLNATIQKTRLRSISLSQIGIQKDGLRALTARNIFGTLVRPLIEYAAQVMDFNKKVTRELEKIQMKFFRGTFGVESTTPKAVLRLLAGVEPVVVRAAKLKLKHYDKIKDTTNTILGPILNQRQPRSRGYTLEIQRLHEKWELQEDEELGQKLNTIEESAWTIDLQKVKALSGEHSCFFFETHYNNTDTKARYVPNNILNTLDRSTREERGKFLRFLVGFSPLLRFEKCKMCGYEYDFSAPGTGPAVHLLVKCRFFEQQRREILEYTKETLETHYKLLGTHFQKSLEGDGVTATAVLMGANDLKCDGKPSKLEYVYRRLGKFKKGEPKTATQIEKIVNLTAKLIWQIVKQHTRSDDG